MKVLNKIIDLVTAPFNFILKNTVGFNKTTNLTKSVFVFFISLIVVLLLLLLIYGNVLFN